MYVIYSASRTDVAGTSVYEGLTTQTVPSKDWEEQASFENLEEAQEALKGYKSAYVQSGPGTLVEYFLVEGTRILEFAEGLPTKKEKNGFNIFAIGVALAIIVVVRLIYTSSAARAFFTTNGMYILLALLVAALIAGYAKDRKKKGKK